MPPEQPQNSPADIETASEGRTVFGDELDALRKTAGPAQPAFPEKPTEAELNEAERSLTGDNIVETFSETYRVNEIQMRRNALQRAALLADPAKAEKVDRAELVTVNQAATYYEYVPSIVQDTMDIMRRYEALRASTPLVSPRLQAAEKQAELYLSELNKALAERTAFSNVLLIDAKLSKHVGDAQTLMKLREGYLNAADLSATSKQVLTSGTLDDKWRQGSALNQRIVDLLAGAAKIPGVDDGFLPQRMYLDLLSERYTQSFEEEAKAVKDVRLVKAKARHDELSRKNDLARDGKGQPLTPEEAEEYEKLRTQIADRDAYMEGLSRQRKELSQEIFAFTDVLATDQMNRAEMATIQNQFGQNFDFEGVSPPNPERTPEDIRKAMGEQMEQRSEFHLERFESFMGRFEEEVLDIGVQERLEDITNKNGREVVRRVNNALSNVLTKLLPESFGVREGVREQLTGPLDEALGWPPGKDNWEELTPEEQENVLNKAKSVLDAIREFDRTKIQQFRGTVDLIRGMPDASTFLNQEVTEPLPAVRVTPDNRQQLIDEHGGATVYMMLFRQMDADWEGFTGEYGSFLTKVNTTIDVHFDVGGELFRLGGAYDDLKWYLIMAAGLAFAAGVLATVGAYKLAKPVGRLMLRAPRLAGRATVEGARATGRVIRGTRDSLSALSRTRTVEELTRMRYLARERQAAQWLEKNVVGRGVAEKFARFNNSKAVRGTAKVLKFGAWAAVPAVTAYEYYQADLRADAVEGDDDLKAEYESQKKTVALEGAGVGATLLVSGMLPAAVLAAPVMYAGNYSRGRSDVLANWKREAASYAREFDASGLREQIRGMTDEAAVEAGGGGTLRPRITFPSRKDQLEAFDAMSAGNKNARAAAYEAYFLRTLMVAKGTPEDEARNIIRDKMQYLRVSDPSFRPEMLNSELQRADAYARLMQRRRAGETVLRYEDGSGESKVIDLAKLTPGAGGDIKSIVGEYVNFVQPVEEVAIAITLGEMAKNRILPSAREKERGLAESRVRGMILGRLQNHITQAEGYVRSIDWPGIDTWVSGGNTASQNVVRTYLADRLQKKLDETVPQLIDGNVDPAAYEEAISSMENIFLELKNTQDTDAFAQAAGKYLTENGLQPRENALDALLAPAE